MRRTSDELVRQMKELASQIQEAKARTEDLPKKSR
jgi:hypothetical protein